MRAVTYTGIFHHTLSFVPRPSLVQFLIAYGSFDLEGGGFSNDKEDHFALSIQSLETCTFMKRKMWYHSFDKCSQTFLKVSVLSEIF